MGAKQIKFFEIVRELGLDVAKNNFGWLTNRVAISDGALWRMFVALDGNPEAMKSKMPRRLSPDGFLPGPNCILEFDELQHFTAFRLRTFDHYPVDTPLGFDIDAYRSWCSRYAEDALKKGQSGYRKPKREFPFDGGRAAQRALFDASRDLLPPHYGLQPTIRVSEFEVSSLLRDDDAAAREVHAALSNYL
ncbi:MAG: hypothetical protein F4233_15470 [Rhodospirillaceae bacterium]|nr:hypothetical protein [Rhodospirillaceae bacterium]